MSKLPYSWNPARDQSRHDRMFPNIIDVTQAIQDNTEQWQQWFAEAMSFQSIILNGLTEEDRTAMAHNEAAAIKEARKNGH